MSGVVLSRSDQPLARREYDVMVIGGGLSGLACAFYLRRLLPQASLLLVERGGIPSEFGATFASPGIVRSVHTSLELADRARWGIEVLTNLVEETGVRQLPGEVWRPVGCWEFHDAASKLNADRVVSIDTALQELVPNARSAIGGLFRLASAEVCLLDTRGGYASAEAAALHFGRGAVRLGADLLLNAVVRPVAPDRFLLDRLEYTRTMSRAVVGCSEVSCARVVVAAGASSGELVEAGLGMIMPISRHYQQYPRIERDERLPVVEGKVALPVLSFQGVTLRPQGEGLLVIPPSLPPDPAGYRPREGRLLGVQVGVRREVLQALLDRRESLSFLAWDSFNLGKTTSRVRGAWQVVEGTGAGSCGPIGDSSWHLLLGESQDLALSLALAYQTASSVAGVNVFPWSS